MFTSRIRRLVAATTFSALIGTGLVACSDDSSDPDNSSSTQHSQDQEANTNLREKIYVPAKIGGAQHTDGPTTSPYSNNTDYILRYTTKHVPPQYLDVGQTTGPYKVVKILDPTTIVVREAHEPTDEEKKELHKEGKDYMSVVFTKDAPDITVHVIGIESPDRDTAAYENTMEYAHSTLRERPLFIEHDSTQPDVDDAGITYAHIHVPTQIKNLSDPLSEPGSYAAATYASKLLDAGQAYFYMPPNQKPHRYAGTFYQREGEAADRGDGIWNGIPDQS